MSENRWGGGIGPYIRMMPSGKKLPLANPTPADYRVRDIAYHLAGIHRYTGGSRISVAQHMVVGASMARRFYPDDIELPRRFLIHDIAEHCIGDVSSPLKSLLPDFKLLEEKHDLVVEQKFGLTFLGVPRVKELDDRMWLTERLMVYYWTDATPEEMAEDTARVSLEPFPLTSTELTHYLHPWGADLAEERYLIALREAFPEVT